MALTVLGFCTIMALAACGESSTTATDLPPTRIVEDGPGVMSAERPTSVPGVEQTAVETASYRVEVWTGPELATMMMMADFPIMSTMDQGYPVNRHLEIHIFDQSSGAKVTDVVPAVKITNKATGASRELAVMQEEGTSLAVAFVMACQMSNHREVEPHFGDNIYLPDGQYKVTVGVGDETAIAEISL